MALQPNTITVCFDSLPDFRVERTKRHKLTDIVFITLCAVLCGFDGWEEIELFAKTKERWLRKFLELANGIPSHDTLRRVFMHLDPTAFQQCFTDWVNQMGVTTAGKVIAVDGKTVRGSRSPAKGKSAIHMVSAWLSDNDMVLGQLKVADKSNEITAIPALLETLVVEGATVTIDAMGCQRTIAQQLIDQKADYVFGLKGNQGNLHEEVREIFALAEGRGFINFQHSLNEHVDAGHGRIEERACYALSSDHIETARDWAGVRSVAMVRSRRWQGEKSQTETRYYLSSLEPEAKCIADAVRQHWSIENGLHWCLDVGFREDDCRVHAGYAAENLSVIRHMAINLLKANKRQKGGIERKRKLAALDDSYLEAILFE